MNLSKLRAFVTSPSPARAGLTYFGTSAFNAMLPLLLLPLMTGALTPADYGKAAIFQAISTVGAVTAYFGMGSTVMRAMTVGAKEERSHYLGSAMAIITGSILLTLAFAAGVQLMSGRLSGLTMFWFLLAAFTGAVSAYGQLYLIVLQSEANSFSYAAFQIGTALLNAVLAIVMVLLLHMGWEGRSLSVLGSNVVGALIAIGVMTLQKRLSAPRVDLIKDAASLGGATLPHSITNIITTVADRFVLSYYFSDSVVGVYAVASQLAMGMSFVGTALHGAVQPVALKYLAGMKTTADRRKFMKYTLIMTAGLAIAGVIYGLTIWILAPHFLNDRYHDYYKYFFVLLAAISFQSIYFLFSYPLFYYRMAKALAGSGIFILAVSLAAALGGVHLFGPPGVALGILSSRLTLLSIAILLSTRATRKNVIEADRPGLEG